MTEQEVFMYFGESRLENITYPFKWLPDFLPGGKAAGLKPGHSSPLGGQTRSVMMN